jgi:hypothetical protein
LSGAEGGVFASYETIRSSKYYRQASNKLTKQKISTGSYRENDEEKVILFLEKGRFYGF